MNVLIIEDEEPAAKRLENLLAKIDVEIKILGTIVSVRSAVQWLKKHPAPELAFMDIQLADGSSFEIFRQVEINFPVIFITAFDSFAIEAFKVNSVDYLLKPVKESELSGAILKYKKLFADKKQEVDYSKLADFISKSKSDYQKRIVIRFRDVIKTIEISDSAFFYTEDKIHYICTKQNMRFPIDYTLDELETILDPKIFFRINRQFIINVEAIEKMVAFSKSRVKIYLKPTSEIETIVSAERSAEFKRWLTGNS